jgi:hypothetical protein
MTGWLCIVVHIRKGWGKTWKPQQDSRPSGRDLNPRHPDTKHELPVRHRELYSFSAWTVQPILFIFRAACGPLASMNPSAWKLMALHLKGISAVARLRAGRPGFEFRKEQGFFSLCHRVQTDSGTHPAFYPMDTGGKSAGAWSWPLTSS